MTGREGKGQQGGEGPWEPLGLSAPHWQTALHVRCLLSPSFNPLSPSLLCPGCLADVSHQPWESGLAHGREH